MDFLFEAASEGKSFFDPGVYIATLVDIRKAEGGNPEFGESRQWVFNLAPYPGDPEDVIVQTDGETAAELWQFSSVKMTPKSKARNWVEAFLGHPMKDGDNIQKSDLIGKYAVITLADEQGKDGKVRSKVAGIRAYDPNEQSRKPQVRTRKAAERAADEEELPF